MSLPVPNEFAIPEETARIARLAFRQTSAVMRLRDILGAIYQDELFQMLFSSQGQPGLSPGLLAMVTVMQYMEGLSDRQAADAVRGRIDWKYALGLELSDAGFNYSVLSEFRQRLLDAGQEALLLEQLLLLCRERKLLKERGRMRTDSTYVLSAVRQLNRLELVLESMQHALNALATQAPDWLRRQVPTEWFDRYGRRVSDFRLPEGKGERDGLAVQVGSDGYALLAALHAPTAPGQLWQLHEVESLRQIWLQQYYRTPALVVWRSLEEMPPGALRICSPHDLEVRASQKRSVEWLGYKVHLTETCDAHLPHLITHVQTTPSTQADSDALAPIQAALADKALLPQIHLVDAGYPTAAHLIASQAQGIDLVCPVQQDTRWQALTPDAYGLDAFVIDWAAHQVHCPNGQTSRTWSQGQRQGEAVIRVQFARATCLACAQRICCTTAQTRGRSLQFHPQPLHEALQQRRQQQSTPAFHSQYAQRSGIEGTLSQAIRTTSLRQARYVGLAKTQLQHIFSAVALNLSRLADWFSPHFHRSQTPILPFAALAPT